MLIKLMLVVFIRFLWRLRGLEFFFVKIILGILVFLYFNYNRYIYYGIGITINYGYVFIYAFALVFLL